MPRKSLLLIACLATVLISFGLDAQVRSPEGTAYLLSLNPDKIEKDFLYKSILPLQVRKDIESKGYFSSITVGQSPLNTPNLSFSSHIISAVSESKPAFVVEYYNVLPISKLTSRKIDGGEWKNLIASIFACSAYQGLAFPTYRGSLLKEVITKAYRVAAPGSHEALPDLQPSLLSLPYTNNFTIFIEGKMSGPNFSTYAIEAENRMLSIHIKNDTALKVAGLTMAAPGGQQEWFYFFRATDGLVFYGLSAPQTNRLFQTTYGPGLAMRAEVFFKWLIRKIAVSPGLEAAG